MDLEAARDLKREIRKAGMGRFATGIAFTNVPRKYRVAIILGSDEDRRLLELPCVKWIRGQRGDDISVEIAGVAHAASSSGEKTFQETPLRIGASIGHYRGGVGSLGFFARRPSDGRVGIVSCNHVIAMVDEGRDDDAIVTPSQLDGRGRVIASLDGSYPRLSARGGAPADCAFAVLNEASLYDPASVPGGTLAETVADVVNDMDVTTIGRVTTGSLGRVINFEVDDLWIRYGSIRVAFNKVIQIGSANAKRFCQHGDSGALVYTSATLQAVGLLFATSHIGGPNDAGWTWVHPIGNVTNALRVEFVNA